MTEEHSFGCIEDRIAMGLYDFSKAQVYQKPKEMTEELEKEAEEYTNSQFGCGDGYYEWTDVKEAYLAGAEPREKQIERLSKEVDDSENMKTTLESQIAELKAQIKKMKCCINCRYCIKEWGEFNPNSPNCKKCHNQSNWKLRR